MPVAHHARWPAGAAHEHAMMSVEQLRARIRWLVDEVDRALAGVPATATEAQARVAACNRLRDDLQLATSQLGVALRMEWIERWEADRDKR